MTAQARTGTDAPEALRDLAEKGAAQAKENSETMSAAAEEATDVLKHSYATTVTSIQDYTTKVFEFTDTNIKAAAEHATKLMSVKTPAEFFTLSNDYGRFRMAALAEALAGAHGERCRAGRMAQ